MKNYKCIYACLNAAVVWRRLDDDASDVYGAGLKKGCVCSRVCCCSVPGLPSLGLSANSIERISQRDTNDTSASVPVACSTTCHLRWERSGRHRLSDALHLATHRSYTAYPMFPLQGTLLLNNIHKAPKPALALLQATVEKVSRLSSDEGR